MHAQSPAMHTLMFHDSALANQLFGPRNAHLDLLAHASGANISSRGSSLLLQSQNADVLQNLCSVFTQVYALIEQGQSLSQQDILRAYRMLEADPTLDIASVYKNTIFVEAQKKTVIARNLAQKAYCDALRHNEMVFAVGPAGTGKTYLAVAMGLAMLQQNKVKRIILTRPAVEAGERLGFLPGDLAEKVNPYLRPLYDALHDMLPMSKVASMMENSCIEVAPLAFMRGRTLSDAFVILDEAQNTTPEQMKMFLTRLGYGSRAVITGDVTQIDLPVVWGADSQTRSGLVHALKVLETVQGIYFAHFTEADVVRHPLVGAIVAAYDTYKKHTD
ncbi:MAG: PhoH family protein [Desulfovibrionaceae bacterium]